MKRQHLKGQLMSQKPVVLVSTNFLEYNGTKAYITREFFVDVLHTLCGSACLLLPSHPKSLDLDSILSRVDGVLLTGSPAHVNPDIYGEKRLFEDKDLDHDRDGTCLPLIKAAI